MKYYHCEMYMSIGLLVSRGVYAKNSVNFKTYTELNFVEISKNLARYRSENNFVKSSK